MLAIVLFDGDCHFCDWSVQFIIQHDRNGTFYFAPLQSRLGKALLEKYQLPISVNSIVVIENDQAFIKSSAVLRICRHLKGLWKIFYTFKVIPKWVLDPVYDFIARNRYKWFGEKNKCKLYPEHIRKRFLTD
ncbi:DCC1-like thiol-disulfide oxidoreductase family protein [Niallia sp. XMNu-256]|uniref:thiol-disulfide oxidoreductase DCC family protein n=1 Tax=Niallia sp. XMNu-256 TaxID=3082444 RepID=UPI0030D502C7